MDNAVALVQACVRLNGYFTVTEHPVITTKRDGTYDPATDLGPVADRFADMGRSAPAHRARRIKS